MRLDYVLYGVAILCFIIAGAFAVANVPGYTLDTTSGIAVTMIFLLLGIISAAVGYSARPKAMMPTTRPMPPETMPTVPKVETPAPAPPPSEEIPSSPPPASTETSPMPLEEPVAPTTFAREEAASEPSTPIVEPIPPPAAAPMEPEQTTVQEETVKGAEPEKPKPTRRRRKRVQ